MIRKLLVLAVAASLVGTSQADYINKNKVGVSLNDFVSFQHVIPQRLKTVAKVSSTRSNPNLFKADILSATNSGTSSVTSSSSVLTDATQQRRLASAQALVMSQFWELLNRVQQERKNRNSTAPVIPNPATDVGSNPVVGNPPVVSPPITSTDEPVIVNDPIKTTTDNTIDDSTLISQDKTDEVITQSNNQVVLDNLSKDSNNPSNPGTNGKNSDGGYTNDPAVLSAPAPATGILAVVGIGTIGAFRLLRRRK